MQCMFQCLQALSLMDYALVGQLVVPLGSLNELSPVVQHSSIANLGRKDISEKIKQQRWLHNTGV